MGPSYKPGLQARRVVGHGGAQETEGPISISDPIEVTAGGYLNKKGTAIQQSHTWYNINVCGSKYLALGVVAMPTKIRPYF